ncbi:MAG: hypothetical protein Q4C68_06325 [Moraxella sp.]|nr:hypothetical protein [Moraxella sp.]
MKYIVIIGVLLTLIGCNNQSNKPAQSTIDAPAQTSNADQNTQTEVKKDIIINAETMVQNFKDAGLPIGQVIVYDEKTDPNKLLNRPNQYTQKVNFEDTSIEQPLDKSEEPFVGGTIEVFLTSEQAQGRKSYVENVTKDLPMVQQYIYVKNTAVLRLDKNILPSDAKKYEEIFMK